MMGTMKKILAIFAVFALASGIAQAQIVQTSPVALSAPWSYWNTPVTNYTPTSYSATAIAQLLTNHPSGFLTMNQTVFTASFDVVGSLTGQLTQSGNTVTVAASPTPTGSIGVGSILGIAGGISGNLTQSANTITVTGSPTGNIAVGSIISLPAFITGQLSQSGNTITVASSPAPTGSLAVGIQLSIASSGNVTQSGATLTVAASPTGFIAVGSVLTIAGANSVTVTALVSGTGGAGTYTVYPSQTVGSSSAFTGVFSPYITALVSGTGGAGTYTVGGPSQTIASGTAFTANQVSTVTALGSGSGAAGTYTVSGPSQTIGSSTAFAGTSQETVTALGTGTGGAGTYTVNGVSQTIGSGVSYVGNTQGNPMYMQTVTGALGGQAPGTSWQTANVPMDSAFNVEVERKRGVSDTDAGMCLYDKTTGYLYTFEAPNVAAATNSLFAYSALVAFKVGRSGWWDAPLNGAIYPLDSPGSGSATNSLACMGLVQAQEMANLNITHALTLNIPVGNARGNSEVPKYVYPATASDGTGGNGTANDFPEGARVCLKPTLTDAYLIATYSMNAADLSLAHAMQKYCMYITDTDGTSNPTISYFNAVTSGNASTIYPIGGTHWPMSIFNDMIVVAPPFPIPQDTRFMDNVTTTF